MQSAPTLPLGEPVADPSPAGLPTRAPLAGRFVTLWPLDGTRDAAMLYQAGHESAASGTASDVWTYMGYGPFAHVAAMEAWLTERQRERDPLFFTVYAHPASDQSGSKPIAADKPQGRAVGMVSYLNIVPAMQRLEIGHIWYGPAAQQTAANTEAAYLLLRAAFDEWGYRRAEWKCDSLNGRSRQAALRLGFRPEGIFFKHMIVRGRNRNTMWFSIVDDEWPAVRTNLEAWLYTDDARPSLTQLTTAAQADLFGKPRQH